VKPKSLTVAFEPLDNARLANLCGVLDENLRQIETAYDVTIARRGEYCRIDGEAAQARLAAAALQHSTCKRGERCPSTTSSSV